MFIPEICEDNISVFSWPDGEKRKNHIAFEYQQQQSRPEGKISAAD